METLKSSGEAPLGAGGAGCSLFHLTEPYPFGIILGERTRVLRHWV